MQGMDPPRFIPPDLTLPRAVPVGPPYPATADWDVNHKYERQQERLHHALDAVSRRISVNQSTRAARWRAAIDRLSNADKRGVLQAFASSAQAGTLDHPYRDAFTALTESRTFIEVIEQLIDYLSDTELRELVRGHPDPSKDNPKTRARNKEFEWYIAALFRRAGLPVAIAEPDVLIQNNGEVRAIAAKRIFSRNKLKSNVKGATEQIERAGYTGYIFLEVTKYINPDLLYVDHWRIGGRVIEPKMTGLSRNSEIAQARSPLVNAVVLRSAFPFISPGFVFGTSERWNVVGTQPQAKDENMLLLHTLFSGLRGV